MIGMEERRGAPRENVRCRRSNGNLLIWAAVCDDVSQTRPSKVIVPLSFVRVTRSEPCTEESGGVSNYRRAGTRFESERGRALTGPVRTFAGEEFRGYLMDGFLCRCVADTAVHSDNSEVLQRNM